MGKEGSHSKSTSLCWQSLQSVRPEQLRNHIGYISKLSTSPHLYQPKFAMRGADPPHTSRFHVPHIESEQTRTEREQSARCHTGAVLLFAVAVAEKGGGQEDVRQQLQLVLKVWLSLGFCPSDFSCQKSWKSWENQKGTSPQEEECPSRNGHKGQGEDSLPFGKRFMALS